MQIIKVFNILKHTGWVFNIMGPTMFPELTAKDKQYILDIADAVKKEHGVEFNDIKNLPDDLELGADAESIHNEYKRWIVEESNLEGLAAEITDC